jgi:hypothetical protein
MGGSVSNCLSSSDTVTIRWNSFMAHIFVTGDMTIENVVFEFGDLAAASSTSCREDPSSCCDFDGTKSNPTQSCERKIDYDQWDTDATSYETKYYAKKKYGFFTFQFLRDYTSAVVPTLTLTSVTVQNLFYSKFHTSFIEIDRFAGKVTITSSTFNRFMMPHGLISNANVDADRMFLWETRYEGITCRSTNPTLSTCHGLTITSSTFENYNPFLAKATLSKSNRFEGSVIMLQNFDGQIKIKSSTFE